MYRSPPVASCAWWRPGSERKVGKEKEAPVSAEEKNKALVRRFWEVAWNKGNLAAVDEFMAPNYVDHPILPGLPPGAEGMKHFREHLLRDLRV